MTLRLLVLGVILLPTLLFAQKGSTLYVSPFGNDQAKGTLDQPFASVQKALTKVAEIRKDNPLQPISILLRQGTYYLNQSIEITNKEAASKNGTLLISAYKDEKVILSGGQQLKLQWEPYKDGVFKAQMEKKLNFDHFFVDGKPQILARYPDYDASILPWHGYAEDILSAERLKSYKHAQGAYIHRMHSGLWGSYDFIIDSVDQKGKPFLTGGYQANRNNYGYHPKFGFIENVMEELNAPGEWFYDKENGIIYYKPIAGVVLSKAVFEASFLENILTIKGSRKQPVSNVEVKGITFQHTLRTFMKTHEQLLRSDWAIYRQGALLIEGAEYVSVENCNFEYLGGNAVFINNYNRNVIIKGNHIHDAGATAINLVGSPDAVRSPAFEYRLFVPLSEMDTLIGPKTPDYPALCNITENLIHDIGQIEKQSAGVNLSMTSEITVSHNSIYDVPRAGINICDGTWGGHDIAFNDVFNSVLETGDHGSFNSWGRDRYWHPDRKTMDQIVAQHPTLILADAYKPTRLHNNRMRCDRGWDIDLDDGSSNYIIYNNLCLNGGLKFREGFHRIAYNNILVNNSFHPHVWFQNSMDEFRNNIVCTEYKPIWISNWGQTIDQNLFPNKNALLKAKANGTDQHSLAGNPLFENPSKGDFSVRKGSLAFAIGFRNFPMNQFGVTIPRLKVLAKTPVIPDLVTIDEKDNDDQIINWRGAKLKRLKGLSEISATGMTHEAGILIQSIGKNSPLIKIGIQPNDVILKVKKKETNSLSEFLSVYAEDTSSSSLKFTIWRNQQQLEIEVIR
ncbi:MAG: PDZ domain-containing protein [Bacteroidetes bacterium]|nr:PDZ domain-containing protein [Bacteroidota bacterium]